jgi:hypothetical protein
VILAGLKWTDQLGLLLPKLIKKIGMARPG